MKRKLKDILAAFIYFLYEKGILHNRIKVHTIDETIDELLSSGKSMVRFGDGEIVMIKGGDLILQKAAPEIGEGLAEILACSWDDLMVTLPDIFDSLSDYRESSRRFWRDHLLFCRKTYMKYCDPDRVYYNSFVSRCYYLTGNRENCDRWFAKIRKIWENKDVVIVEGTKTHNGVGNDLLDTARSVERIICPPKDAYSELPRIVMVCSMRRTGCSFCLQAWRPSSLHLRCFREDTGFWILGIWIWNTSGMCVVPQIKCRWPNTISSGRLPTERWQGRTVHMANIWNR